MAERSKLFLVAGARPNFMKIAPLCRALRPYESCIEPVVVHTGQHYDYTMSRVFFEQLGLPEPQHHLEVGSGSHACQTAQVMLRFERLVEADRPAAVVVVGDVNSTIAAALTAVKLHIPVAHVESGLRSFDLSMPEEVNRLLTDHVSTLLFATEPAAVTNLAREGIPGGRVHLVGNVMIDELLHNLDRIRGRGTVGRFRLMPKGYTLATIHRPVNVDEAAALQAVLAVLREAASRRPVVFPVHPRTIRNIESSGLRETFAAVTGLRLLGPQGYLDFLSLLDGAACVLTDSGGIQCEAAWLDVPCITLRDRTEHVVTVEQGYNRLTRLDAEDVNAALDWAAAFDNRSRRKPAVWDGHAAERTASVLAHALPGPWSAP